MRITMRQLKKLTVETLSGAKLGKIDDVIVDIDEQLVVQYQVKHTGIGGSDYLIHRDQVARFEEKKMVVYDTVLTKKEKSTPPSLKVKVLPEARGVSLRQ